MKPELDEALCKKYPHIFRDRHASMSKTCMCWGFPGDGWYKLIEDICEKMMEIKRKYGVQYIADQVKEKFGGLRFYFSEDGRLLKISKKKRSELFEEVSDFVNKKEEESCHTCEECGNEGELRHGGWIVCLCDSCQEKRMEERKQGKWK